MTRTNDDIRKKAKSRGVYLYEVADKLGIQDSAFSRMLRHPLSNEMRQRIHEIIETFRRDA